MAILTDLYIKKETLQTMIDVLNKKGENGISLTIAINDEFNQWNQNTSAFVSQTKQQKDSAEKKFYVGNGKTLWHNNVMPPIPNRQATNQSSGGSETGVVDGDDDLPF